MLKKITVAGICMLAVSTAASADALMLLNQDDAGDTPPPPAAVEKTPWYVAAAVGGNIALNAKMKDTDVKFKFKTGVGVNLGVGYAFAENLAVEVRSGIMWNKIKEVEGTYMGNAMLSGGSGHMYQVPVMASVVYSLPINEKTNLGIKAGAGIQWTDFKADSITLTTAPLLPLDNLSYSNKSTAFRWELGLQLATQVATNVRVGGGVIFGGTSEVNIGELSGNSMEDKLKGLYNVSLGFGVNIAF